MQSLREKPKNTRIILAYTVEKISGNFKLFEVIYKDDKRFPRLIGEVENPHGQFPCHHYDKVERLIAMALENGGRAPKTLLSAYPMINGNVMEYKDLAIKNLAA